MTDPGREHPTADDRTFSTENVISDAGGNTTTVGHLMALVFWFDLEAGQTEAHDALRLHLLSAHGNLAATTLTDAEALDQHTDEHRGPGTIRNHDPESTGWNFDRALQVLTEVDDGFLTEEQAGDYGQTFSAHVERVRVPGSARQKPGGPVEPTIFEETSRYTISVLPPDDPRRRHYQVHVVNNTPGQDCARWYVEHTGFWADANGAWEPISGDGYPTHTFTRDDALTLARRLAPTVESNDRTALDVLAMPREGRR